MQLISTSVSLLYAQLQPLLTFVAQLLTYSA